MLRVHDPFKAAQQAEHLVSAYERSHPRFHPPSLLVRSASPRDNQRCILMVCQGTHVRYIAAFEGCLFSPKAPATHSGRDKASRMLLDSARDVKSHWRRPCRDVSSISSI